MKENVQRICEAIGARFGLELDDILRRDRHKTPAAARQCCMFVLRSQLGFSYPEIGRELGNRDHTTAMHACRKVDQLLTKGDPRILAAVNIGIAVVDQILSESRPPVKAVDRPFLEQASGQ
jgi:chromosomal replication initiation ATPase DnaA